MVDHQLIQVHLKMEILVVLVVVEAAYHLQVIHLVGLEIHLLQLRLKEAMEVLVKEMGVVLIITAAEAEEQRQ